MPKPVIDSCVCVMKAHSSVTWQRPLFGKGCGFERFCSGATQSCAWDIFSLGIAFIAFVSGRLPFDFRQDVPEQLLSAAYLANAAALLSGTELRASARRTVLYMVHPDPEKRIGNYADMEGALGVVGRNPRFTFPWIKRQPWP